MSIASFWGTHRWSSRWGVVDAWHPTPHKGLDSGAGIHEAVPFLRPGIIVEIGRSGSVGNYIVVQSSAADFDTYCHILHNGLSEGQRVAAGQENMIAAGPNDIHGTSWDGAHCHYARGADINGWAYWPNLNPEEVVREALGINGGAGTAGVGNKEYDMALTDPIIPETGKGDLNAYIYYTRKDVLEIKQKLATGGVDIAALAEKIAPLIKVDYAALAKAVNDDAARRLSA